MLISLDWLSDYVDIDCDVETLSAKLVSAGFEVEEIIKLNDKCKNVVVGRIEALNKHPDADKLQVCQINIGSEVTQIVTGADNIKLGDLVPVALDNSDLPNGVHIKKGKLRGVLSNGMLCSGSELKLTEDDYVGASVNGIMILTEEYPLGTPIANIIGLNDTVIDVGVTANRPDCNSVFGIAREVATVLNKPLKMPSFEYKTSKKDINSMLSIKVLNTELCKRYMGGVVENIIIKPSPNYIRNRLKAIGLRPVNNIVDITNYVLNDIGQPMHAFDYNLIDGEEIIVRNAQCGEKIIALDSKEYTLDDSILAICNVNKPMAIAGIMGGELSAITDNTKKIVFESANFMRENIRRSSRKINLRSDSSTRYERGIDLASQELGLKRALALISETNSGDIVDGIIDICSLELQPKQIVVNYNQINKILGITVPTQTMLNILNSLQIITVLDGENLQCTVPLYREDIENANDLAEEIIRLYGYDNIVPSLLDGGKQTIGGKTTQQRNIDNIKALLVGEGCNETYSYSFTTPKMFDVLGMGDDDINRKAITLLNPLGEDLSVMRTTLSYTMMEIIAKNLARNNKAVRFFEIANTYRPKALPLVEQPVETTKLSIGIYGTDEDFYTLKGIIENVIHYYGVNAKYVRANVSYLHPGISADIMVDNENIGNFGEVHPNTLKSLDIKTKFYIAEIDIDKLNSLYNDSYEFVAIPKFPSVERDIAVVVKESVTAEELMTVIKKYAGKTLNSAKIFDIYRGKGVEDGSKSVAIKIIFNAVDKTLTEEEITSKINKIIKMLEKEVQAKLR